MFRTKLCGRALLSMAGKAQCRAPLFRTATTSNLGVRNAVKTHTFVAPLLTSSATYTTGDQKGNPRGTNDDAADADSGLDFEFDPMASVQHDAAVETAKKSFEAVLEELLPERTPPAAVETVRRYLQQHPVDSLITAAKVQITHVENAETGAEEKASLSPVPLEEALEQSQFRKMNLVQMGARGDTAFCRIRNEKPWVYKLIAEEVKAYEEEQEAMQRQQELQAGGTGRRPHGGRGGGGMKSLVDNVFRDAVDAHFIGWKSKKICEDIKRGHPVKLTIREFQSSESAMMKLREMANAMRHYAEEKHIYHHFTSIVGNDREASITFSPAVENKQGQISKTVKHPGEREWAHALKRMQDACQRTGRLGTYAKTGALKPRNVGSSLYRTDKYGRRVE